MVDLNQLSPEDQAALAADQAAGEREPQILTDVEPESETPTPAKPKKAAKCKKVYMVLTGEGDAVEITESAHAGPSVDELQFRFANGNTHPVGLSDYPQDIQTAFAWNGLAQKLGDGYANSDSVSDAEEMFLTLHERLIGGEWVKAREGGAVRPSMVVEAVIACLVANGEEVTDERREAIRTKLKTNEARSRALANPAINDEYKRIRDERDKAKLDKVPEAATLGDF